MTRTDVVLSVLRLLQFGAEQFDIRITGTHKDNSLHAGAVGTNPTIKCFMSS